MQKYYKDCTQRNYIPLCCFINIIRIWMGLCFWQTIRNPYFSFICLEAFTATEFNKIPGRQLHQSV